MVDDTYLNGYAKHLGTTTSMVYISLCRHADKNQIAFPSQEIIAEKLGISKRTVLEKIKILEKWNLIKKEQIKNKEGKWLNNTYLLLDKIHWKKPGAVSPHAVRQHTDLASPGVVKQHTEPGAVSQHKPGAVSQHYKETHIKETHITPIVPFLEEFNKAFGTKFRETDNRKKLLKQRLKRYSLDEIISAVRKMSSDSFYQGENDRNWRADPDYLLRTDEQIDKFLNMKEKDKYSITT